MYNMATSGNPRQKAPPENSKWGPNGATDGPPDGAPMVPQMGPIWDPPLPQLPPKLAPPRHPPPAPISPPLPAPTVDPDRLFYTFDPRGRKMFFWNRSGPMGIRWVYAGYAPAPVTAAALQIASSTVNIIYFALVSSPNCKKHSKYKLFSTG